MSRGLNFRQQRLSARQYLLYILIEMTLNGERIAESPTLNTLKWSIHTYLTAAYAYFLFEEHLNYTVIGKIHGNFGYVPTSALHRRNL